ncbi:unnamed protein product [Ectocarpus sp. CCAP 1310/34]|nr:unnamed protein product [Ectocarpus sp. CCAP 1310/34]
MDNWRQDKCTEINKALERIEKRADRVSRMMSSSSSALNQEDQPQHQQQEQQQQQQVATLTNELARLQDMNNRLFDFRDRLCFYSNLGYVEALNEWQYEIRK